jgi:formate-nitrite transporter family protein
VSVELVEWGDFECPYCRRAAPSVRHVLDELGDRVTFVWRHFPITEKHPHAARAAEAAEAARAQGRFREMHDALFAHQDALSDDDLVGYAREIGLDAERFADDLRSGRYADAVAAERAEGEKAGVTGTPAFFIDGERYRGFYDAETLLDALIDAGA